MEQDKLVTKRNNTCPWGSALWRPGRKLISVMASGAKRLGFIIWIHGAPNRRVRGKSSACLGGTVSLII